ncbi:hypothetical protein D9756_001648 [Leucocoprinus leucothites]|uniref:Protein OS-9 homolog n=1 Tax=Leucocoprinus leucothites TaxID=201217 RepID=A0A8H5LI27_9AGAR|nr:hypothetical protein D9756_001648 [Leucoagaricus leucothites]
MRTLASHLVLALSTHAVVSRLLHSLPEDTYAFPKFRVEFLNSLPVLNETAERWLKDGLPGGEFEFLEQHRKTSAYSAPSGPKGIESGQPKSQDEARAVDASAVPDNLTLELLRLGPKDSYVCLIPKPLDTPPPPPEEQSDTELTPARGWALLEALTGTCLYYRHGWFTYSYCHNHEIRQFKELVPQSTRLAVSGPLCFYIGELILDFHIAGSYVPEEDPEWESYTLGRAPTQPAPGADLTVAERNAHATNLELAKHAGSRYLVQRWGDGTLCDKTGKNREVEVQFHCSMTMTDNILFVKETKTCSYVLVISTPRLCGEPGFRSPRDAAEEAKIRCREVVETLPEKPLDYPVADYPIKGGPPPQQPILPPPAAAEKSDDGKSKSDDEQQDRLVNDLLLQTIQALIGKTRSGKTGKSGEPTEIIIELGDDAEDGVEVSDKLMEALRAAGYDVLDAEFLGLNVLSKEGDKEEEDGRNGNKKDEKKRRLRRSTDDVDENARDEL